MQKRNGKCLATLTIICSSLHLKGLQTSRIYQLRAFHKAFRAKAGASWRAVTVSTLAYKFLYKRPGAAPQAHVHSSGSTRSLMTRSACPDPSFPTSASMDNSMPLEGNFVRVAALPA